ncbi:glycoside hydrolase family 71/99-like protein [Mucilaginibacter sp.]|uniref:glycoside hydrolase family 71/99-like protein n=1 Tax=Mucilaginibacter sp. TaxID=1882438 RepID=UPI002604A8EC|nr:glycoside hydrolase family 71/99-like protein [Mucilaginibacter sp.]
MKTKITFLACLLCFTTICRAQSKHSKTSLFPTYKGLIMAGYQGWFRAEGDGSGSKRFAYGNEQRGGMDMWPDVTEYAKTYQTSFVLKSGEKARVFSSYDKSSVDLHFKWMQQYGVDGVFVQRFFGTVRSRDKESSVVLKNALEAASKYKRAIAIMYDLSGLAAKGEDCTKIIDDWKYLVDELKVTNQDGAKTYLNHNGKPVVAIWGIGFNTRPYNIRNIGIEKVIDFLKNDPVYGGCTVMLGVPNQWRELRADCLHDPYLHTLIKSADIIFPWSVQRYSPLMHNDMDRFKDDRIDDMKWCAENHIDYVPTVFPGFSWHNLSVYEFPDDIKPAGSIPREGGRFYWQQMYTVLSIGSPMVYVAMFDEMNEGTAIFKTTDNPPVSQNIQFINMDGKPSDTYLWLTGEAGKMLRNEIPLSSKMPVRQ